MDCHNSQNCQSSPQDPLLNLQDFNHAAVPALPLAISLADILNDASASIVNFRVYADRDWQYDYYSAGCLTVLGFTAAELMADKYLWRSRVHPQDWETLFPQVYAAIFAEQSYQYEYRFYHADGSLRWISAHSTSRRHLTQDWWVVTAVNTDISDRKAVEIEHQQALQELRQSKQLLQLVFDTLPQRVFWKDKNFNYLGCNQRFAEDAGLDAPAEIIGRNDFELPWRESAPLYRTDDAQIIQNGLGKTNYEEPLVRRDGAHLWLRTSKIPLRNAANEIIGVFGSYEDITEKRQQEDMIRNIALGVSAATGEAFFQSLVRYISKALSIEFVSVFELSQPGQTRVRSIAFYGNGQILEHVEQDLLGTPYAEVLNQRFAIFQRNTCKLFPHDSALAERGIEGFIGVPLFASTGKLQGLLSAMSCHPLKQTQPMLEILQIFAVRASAELERRQAERSIQQLNQRLEQRVKQRTQELEHSQLILYQQLEQGRLTLAIMERIRESLDLEEILKRTVEEIQQVLQVDRVLVYRHLPDGRGVTIAEALVSGGFSLLGTTLPPEELLQNTVHLYCEQGFFAVTDCTQVEPTDGLAKFLAHLPARAKLLVPILGRGMTQKHMTQANMTQANMMQVNMMQPDINQPDITQQDSVWGLLIAHEFDQPRQWQPWEIELMRQISSQLSIAIQQAALYQQVQIELRDRKHAEDQLRSSLREKEVLLKEVHHRVKNNLQLVSSLLNLQMRSIQDPQALEPFQESQQRIHVMALIHEQLYCSENCSQIDFASYIRNLASSLFQTHFGRSNIQLNLNVVDVQLGIDVAIPCGMIVNELVSNSIKHAFPISSTGTVTIRFCCNAQKTYQLLVQDDGIGIPETIDIDCTQTLGLQIVRDLTMQLDGNLRLDRIQGTTFTIEFPIPSE